MMETLCTTPRTFPKTIGAKEQAQLIARIIKFRDSFRVFNEISILNSLRRSHTLAVRRLGAHDPFIFL